jgi:hypothetical protein
MSTTSSLQPGAPVGCSAAVDIAPGVNPADIALTNNGQHGENAADQPPSALTPVRVILDPTTARNLSITGPGGTIPLMNLRPGNVVKVDYVQMANGVNLATGFTVESTLSDR